MVATMSERDDIVRYLRFLAALLDRSEGEAGDAIRNIASLIQNRVYAKPSVVRDIALWEAQTQGKLQ
jgi:hypothetical protein